MKELKVIELFSGIGSQRKALKKLNINYKMVGISEIDKNAIKSYESIFGKTYNYGDISKISKLDKADFWTYSFPCTDISSIGKNKGIKKGTHSGLLLEVKRLLEIASSNNELPKYLMLENVKRLISKKFVHSFNEWLVFLESLGYKNYWKVINSTDVGVPQNRERIFVISILNGENFEFSNDVIKLKNIKDYLIDGWKYENHIKEKVDKRIKKGCRIEFENRYNEIINCHDKTIFDCRAKTDFQDKKVGITVSPTIKAQNSNCHVLNGKRIQRLKDIEAWRLMGFEDEDYYRAKQAGNSMTALYKQAGNSIVVDVLVNIFKNLFSEYVK